MSVPVESDEEVVSAGFAPGIYRVGIHSVLSLATVGRPWHKESIRHLRELARENVYLPPIAVAAIDIREALENLDGTDLLLVRSRAEAWPLKKRVLVVCDGKQRHAALTSSRVLESMYDTIAVELVTANSLRAARLHALRANAINGRALTKADHYDMIDLAIRSRSPEQLESLTVRALAKELCISAERVERRVRFAHHDACVAMLRNSAH